MKLSIKFIIPTILFLAVSTAVSATLAGIVIKDVIDSHTEGAYQKLLDDAEETALFTISKVKNDIDRIS